LLEDARRLAKEMNGNSDNKQVMLRVNVDVAKALRSTERDVMVEIEDYLGPIDITSEPTLHQEQFDFALI
jgi:Ribonuclease G/E